jgi:hypothetical protein
MQIQGWEYSSEVEHLTSIYKPPGLIPSTKSKSINKYMQNYMQMI